MIIYDNEKLTATQAAKRIIFELGTDPVYYGDMSDWRLDVDKLTDKETNDVYEAVFRQVERVKTFLGL